MVSPTYPLAFAPVIANALLIAWVVRALGAIPATGPFLVTQGPPFSARPRPVVRFLVGAAACALLLWSTALACASDTLIRFGALAWALSLLFAGLFGWTLRETLRRPRRLLALTPSPGATLTLDGGGETIRVQLAGASVSAHRVTIDGMVGFYAQFFINDGNTRIALFVDLHEPRHFALVAGAPTRTTPEGWAPILRGPELLDALAPWARRTTDGDHPDCHRGPALFAPSRSS